MLKGRTQTPKGHFVLANGVGDFDPGDQVTVKQEVRLDAQHAGKGGKLLGWSIPHGYAVVQADDGTELILHPESLYRT